MMKIFGVVAVAFAVAIAAGIGYVVASHASEAAEANIGQLTVDGAERASESVRDMAATFDEMSPRPVVQADYAVHKRNPVVAEKPATNPVPDGYGFDLGADEADTPDTAQSRIDALGADGGGALMPVFVDADAAHGSEVQRAFALMQRYAEMSDGNDEYVKAARRLKEAWEPLFLRAYADYNAMNADIEAAKKTALIYFARQTMLTQEINDPAFRAELEAHDERERLVFANWEAQADGVAESAYEMMRDIEDIDVFITKANLSAHFPALRDSANKMPASMIRLNGQLADFREATKALSETIGRGGLNGGA